MAFEELIYSLRISAWQISTKTARENKNCTSTHWSMISYNQFNSRYDLLFSAATFVVFFCGYALMYIPVRYSLIENSSSRAIKIHAQKWSKKYDIITQKSLLYEFPIEYSIIHGHCHCLHCVCMCDVCFAMSTVNGLLPVWRESHKSSIKWYTIRLTSIFYWQLMCLFICIASKLIGNRQKPWWKPWQTMQIDAIMLHL